MDLILGALIGAAATLIFSLARDLIHRRWSKEDGVIESAKIKAERADQRSEDAAGRIVDLADSLRDSLVDSWNQEDDEVDSQKEISVWAVTREIRNQAIRLTNTEARVRIETAADIAASAESIHMQIGGQLGQIGWRIAREIRLVAGALLRNEPIPPNSIEDYVEVWEMFDV